MPLQPLPANYENPMAGNNYGPLFEQYKVTYGKALEFVQANLYDTVNFTGGTTTTLSVFDGTRNITNNKIICNMPGNTLPDRQGFLVMALQFIPMNRPIANAATTSPALQNGNVDDFAILCNNGIFELKLYEKIYAQVPLIMLPAACGIVPYWLSASPAATPGGVLQYVNNGLPDARNLYTLEEPVFIPPLVQIQAQLAWNGPQTTFSPTVPLKFNMGGLMVRPVQ